MHELLAPLDVTQVQHLGVSLQRVNELVNGKRGVTDETAYLLAQAFDTTPAVRPTRRVRPLERVA